MYFRISEDEFRQFVSVCEQAGARSISELARNAVQRLIADGQRHQQDNSIDQKIQALERLIAAVTEQLQLLTVKQAPEETLEFARSADSYFLGTKTTDQNGRGEE